MSDLPAAQGTGIPRNLAGALSYLLGPLTGIVFLVLEKEDPFVRFHAAQSIVIGVAMIAVSIGLSLVGALLAVVPIVGWVIGFLLSIGFAFAAFALWVLLMFRAFQGHEWQVPVASTYARKMIEG